MFLHEKIQEFSYYVFIHFVKKKIQSKLYTYIVVNRTNCEQLRLITNKYLKQAVLISLFSCIQIVDTKSHCRKSLINQIH